MSTLVILLVWAGCGSIAYEDSSTERVREQAVVAYAVPTYAYAYAQPQVAQPAPPLTAPPQLAPPQPALAQGAQAPVVYVLPPAAPAAPLPPPRVVAPPPQMPRPQPALARYGNAAVTCTGNQRIRISEERVDGGDGPAIYASGNCVVEIDESILRGEPAIVATGNAQLRVSECRIQGDVVTQGAARVATPGSRLEGGRLLHL